MFTARSVRSVIGTVPQLRWGHESQLHMILHLELAALKESDHLTAHNCLGFQKSSSGTPGEKRNSPNRDDQHQPPVVIIFKDLEAFNPKVLQDFILICR